MTSSVSVPQLQCPSVGFTRLFAENFQCSLAVPESEIFSPTPGDISLPDDGICERH
jgi:hypothetical protein